MTIRLLLADDHQIVREGLRSVLESHADLMVVAEAGDGRQTMRLAEKTSIGTEELMTDYCGNSMLHTALDLTILILIIIPIWISGIYF